MFKIRKKLDAMKEKNDYEKFKKMFENGTAKAFMQELTRDVHCVEDKARWAKEDKLRKCEKWVTSFYNESEIEKLLDNPDKFFDKGWLFNSLTFTSLSILWITDDSGSTYSWHDCLPNSFWENPKLVKKLCEASKKYWSKKAFELDKKINNKEINGSVENEIDRFKRLILGFDMLLKHKQLDTVAKMQYNLSSKMQKSNSLCNNFDSETKKECYSAFKSEINKIKNLKEVPVYKTSVKESENLYNKVCWYQDLDARGEIYHKHGLDCDW